LPPGVPKKNTRVGNALIDKALRMAAREALLRYKQAGVPIVVWRRGKVVRIPASQIKVPPRPRRAK
jgi:hypothetical protein